MEKLALFGGPASVTPKHATTGLRPGVPPHVIERTSEMLTEGEISISPVVRELEEKFAEYIGVKYVLAVCNGTTALQEALYAVGICPGDEVIVPSYTFWAGVAPVMASLAKPVFCDIDEGTYCLTAETIERCITPKTRAILLVHVWGNPCDMGAIQALAEKHDIAVIEDCAHAHGATLDGHKVGTFGHVNMFSLQGSKVMRAGEGGFLATDNRALYERAVAMGHYERLAALPQDSPYRKYAQTGLGFKHRMHPLGAPLALADLATLDEMNALRDGQGLRLEQLLAGLPFLSFQRVLPGARRLYSYHYARYHREQLGGLSLGTFLSALKAEGLTVGICGYGRLHEAPFFTRRTPHGQHWHAAMPCFAPAQPPPALPVTRLLREETFLLAPRFEAECPWLVAAYAHACEKVWYHREVLLLYELKNPPDEQMLERARSNSVNLI